ncbi:hypothetical protein LCGC14_0742420 [marine sediment metagenome]|uniref:Uncharacterized protein n=1 Tax=marine sediment metagenome TaxID=412755 RepID=A0A0F9QAJ9_9ZZZZ
MNQKESEITEEQLMALLRQAVEDVAINCPKCETRVEADIDKCFECGWINQLKVKGFI